MVTGVREVRRGDVRMRMVYDDREVHLACTRHHTHRIVSLDAGAFGRELVTFFQEHEECSAGQPGVVVDLAGSEGQPAVDGHPRR